MIRYVLQKQLRLAFAISAAGSLLAFSSAFAQEPSPTAAVPSQGGPTQNTVGATAAANTGSEATAERVVVTGSNIPTAEEVGPNPVDTYRAEDIQKLGVRNSTDLVQKLPGVTGGAIVENISNGGDGRVEVNLRGILAKETLVLLDGRRLANVGFAGSTVDVNTLLLIGLVDHIDVLKDGASAIYGTDAVAGVFNVFYKHKFRGLEMYFSYGNTNLGASNDQHEIDAYLLAGTGDDKTDIVVYAEYLDRGAIYSRDRDISSNADARAFGGSDIRSGNFAGRIGSRQLANGLVAPLNTPGTHPYATDAAGFAAAGYLPRSSGAFTNAQLLFNFSALTPSFPASDREHFYGSFTRDICDKWLTVFADFKYDRTFFDSGLAPAPFSGPPDAFNDGSDFVSGNPISATGITVPTQNAFSPFSGGNTTVNGIGFITGVRYRGVEAGLRTDKITTDNYLFTGGIRGSFSDLTSNDIFKTWGYEAGFRYNRDSRLESFGGIVNVNALRTALLSTDPNTAFDPFGRSINGTGIAGRTNRSVLDQVFVTTQHAGQTDLTLEDAKIYGDIFNLPAGPLSFALGGEHRKETTRDAPDPLTSSGQTLGATNFQPTRGNRDVWAIYGELRIPVTSPSWNFPGLYSLEFDLAERYENFSDFGDTEKPKFSVRWQPLDSSLTVRATYNEAFHAPTLSELFQSQAQSFPSVVDPAGLSEPQINQTIGGNPNLAPENAYEWTYGAVFTPKFVPGLTLSADWYHIDLRGQTTTLTPAFILSRNFSTANSFVLPPNPPVGYNGQGVPVGGQFSDLITRDPNTGAILNVVTIQQNLARVITEGLDYEAIYSFPTSKLGRGDFGTVTATINGNYLSRYEFAGNPGSKEVDITGTGPGGGFGNLSHHRFYASLFYDLGGFDAGLTFHYLGQYDDDENFTAPAFFKGIPTPRKVREFYTFDLIASYTFNFPAPVAEESVAGYAKDGGKNVKMKDGKDKTIAPMTTASYAECGWRSWLNGMTLTAGMNNIFDEDPPFVASAFANNYDESAASIRGRVWYVAVRKRF